MEHLYIMLFGKKVFIKRMPKTEHGVLLEYCSKRGKEEFFYGTKLLSHLLSNYHVGKIMDEDMVKSLLDLKSMYDSMATRSNIVIGVDNGKIYFHSICDNDTFCMSCNETKEYKASKVDKKALRRILLGRELMLN